MFECELVSETFGANFLANLDFELELFIGTAYITMKSPSTLKEEVHQTSFLALHYYLKSYEQAIPRIKRENVNLMLSAEVCISADPPECT